MSVLVNCPSCQAQLRAPDTAAGKKMRCPRCKTVLEVPAKEEEEIEEVDVVEEEPAAEQPPTEVAHNPFDFEGGGGDAPAPKKKAKSASDDAPTVRQKKKSKPREEEEEEEESPRKKKKGKWVACPKCGAGGAKRVKYTMWGSFYGPALFNHVRCGQCGYCYNGKTGGSNMIVATLFVLVPLIGIIILLYVIYATLKAKGYEPGDWIKTK